jgi:uncharacterized membrane protein
MFLLKAALTCLVLSILGLVAVPLAAGKVAAAILAVFFVLFLVLGLATVDNLAA